MDNKHESRPYFLAIREKSGIIWLIPLSSQVEKYRAKLKEDERRYGESIFHYITDVAGRKRAILIGNCIPVSDKYIVRPFTVNGIPYVFGDAHACKDILRKFRRYIALVRRRKLSPAVNILDIEQLLLSNLSSNA